MASDKVIKENIRKSRKEKKPLEKSIAQASAKSNKSQKGRIMQPGDIFKGDPTRGPIIIIKKPKD